MKILYYNFTLLLIFISLSQKVQAQPTVAYSAVVTGLSSPVDAVFAPGDGRMFIAQQNGLIRIRNGAALLNYINIASVLTNPSGGEQGLLSLAFHPNYASNRYFFVLYTGATGSITLARYQRNISDPNIADPASGQVLLSIAKPGSPYYTNHNGGKIIFGTDGYLYISTGDGGSGGDPGNLSQNRTSLLGKMLRIDVNSFATSAPFYTIPSTNPYSSTTDGFADEIFSYGLRNPWRWSFDRQNGDFWIADVGQGAWEEINYANPARALGGNYGWRCYEGAHNYNTTGCGVIDSISPVSEYGHNNTTGGYSITGGYVYRGSVFPTLQGYYMAADYITGHLWLVKQNGATWQTYFQSTSGGGISNNVAGFAEGPNGEAYAINRGGGRIDSIIVLSTVPVIIQSFSATAKKGYNLLQWQSSTEVNTMGYNIEVSEDGVNYTRLGNVTAANAPNSYQFSHTTVYTGYLYYRLAIDNSDGSVQYSNIVRVRSGSAKKFEAYPTLITKGNTVNIELKEPSKELLLINTNGQVLIRKIITGQMGNIRLTIPSGASAGLYLIRIINNNNQYFSEKIMIQ